MNKKQEQAKITKALNMDHKSDAYWDGYINAMMEGVEEGKV